MRFRNYGVFFYWMSHLVFTDFENQEIWYVYHARAKSSLNCFWSRFKSEIDAVDEECKNVFFVTNSNLADWKTF